MIRRLGLILGIVVAAAGEPVTGGVPAADVVHPSQGHRRGVRLGLGAAVAIAAATLGLAGMGAVLGAATGPVLLLAAGGATPWFWTRLRPRIDRYVVGRTAVGRECPVEPNLATGPPPLVSALEVVSSRVVYVRPLMGVASTCRAATA